MPEWLRAVASELCLHAPARRSGHDPRRYEARTSNPWSTRVLRSTPPSWRVLPLPRWVLGAVRARTRDCDAWIRLFVGHTFTVQVLHKQSHPGVRSHRPAAGQLSRRGWCRLPSSSLLHSATLGKRVFTTLHGSAVSPSAVSSSAHLPYRRDICGAPAG